VLNERHSTMIIISHDRHFLNSVCTHMADLDYRELRIYPGDYDDYMEASTIARQRQMAANARTKERVAELEDFVRRFSANKSKARQATSRQRQIEKIKVEDVKPSSRQYPFIRFDFDDKEKLHRSAVEVKGLSKSYDKPLLKNLSLSIEAGEKVAIIGPNGVGKTTLLRCLFGNLQPDAGVIKWTEKARPGYCAQDNAADFAEDVDLVEWIGAWRGEGDDETKIRGTLGRLLFSGDDVRKSVKVVSGGEERRLIFGKLMLQRHNVLLLDEPTNHLDMESIESLNDALDRYEGTLVFVSHDREFVSSLATRVIEIHPGAEGEPASLIDFRGSYEDYLRGQSVEE
jgi:ATPase subunit of ABC transporter with duplicated ATPase domains